MRDSTSGLRLLFADGGGGQLTLTPLTATPPPPVPGSGWRMAYSGSQKAEVVLEGNFDGSTAYPAAYVYEELPPGAVDDAPGRGPRWIPLPLRQVAPGRWAFELWPGGGTPAAAAGRRGVLATTNTAARNYYIGQLEKGSTDTDKRIGLHGLAGVYVDDFIATLPAALAAQVRARRAEKLLSWGEDGSYYRGFTYQPNRRLYPIISISLDGFSLAHETGHYLTHLLVGHDAYERLHNQPYPEQHGPRLEVGRGSINDDYAYFIESFLKGTGGQYDLANASGSYLRARPAGADVPAIEGFTAAMLAATVRTTNSIPSIDLVSKLVDVPVVGLSYGRVFELLAGGPQTVEAVRTALEAGLDADGRRRLLVNLQRLGWRYSATLRVVDPAGNPVPNAPATLLVRAGGAKYTSDVGTTDAQGRRRRSRSSSTRCRATWPACASATAWRARPLPARFRSSTSPRTCASAASARRGRSGPSMQPVSACGWRSTSDGAVGRPGAALPLHGGQGDRRAALGCPTAPARGAVCAPDRRARCAPGSGRPGCPRRTSTAHRRARSSAPPVRARARLRRWRAWPGRRAGCR